MKPDKMTAFNIPFEQHLLANGLTLILHEDHRLPQAAVNIWYHVGSKDEEPGRTGFAHLFEHLMFQGSEHYSDDFFKPLEVIGARLNGSTAEDRTNYWEVVPTPFLERVLWLESDRMGWLPPAIDQAKLDNQREVVKNERRQTMDNQPYGIAEEACLEALYPPGHPYHHSVIGSMDDLDAATLDDVKDFFRRFYTPNNASLCVAGDIEPKAVIEFVEKYFAGIPRGPLVSPMSPETPVLQRAVRVVVEDRVVLPRLYLQWPTTPQLTGDAATLAVLSFILSTGKDSRLVKSLQIDHQLAQSIGCYQMGGEVAGIFEIIATAQRGVALEAVEEACWKEVRRVKEEGVLPEEVKNAVESLKAGVVKRLQMVGGFSSISDMLNYYQTYTGHPGGLPSELARYEAVTPADVLECAGRYLHENRYALVGIAPAGPTPVKIDRTRMPGKGKDATFSFPKVERRKLPNGMELCVLSDHHIPMVTVAAVVRVGSIADPPDDQGLAHFTAGLLDESAAGMGPLELARRQKTLATTLSTTVDREDTLFTLSLLKEHLGGGLDLMGDVLLLPGLREEDAERIKKEMLAGLARRLDDPTELGNRALKAALYGAASPYGHPQDGTPSSIRKLAAGKARDFYQKWYTPGRSMLVVVGDISTEEAFDEAARVFGKWSGDGKDSVDKPAAEGSRAGGLYLVEKNGAPQSYITAAQPALSRLDSRYPAFVILNAVFGGQFTSRINMNLREDKGYTYGAQSYLEAKSGTMPWLMQTSVQTDKTAESLLELRRELTEIVKEAPVTEKEFTNARDNFLLRYPQRFETQAQLAESLAVIWLYGLPWDYHERMLDALGKLSLDEVRKTAADLLHPDTTTWVVVGDNKSILPALSTAGFEEPKIFDGRDREELNTVE